MSIWIARTEALDSTELRVVHDGIGHGFDLLDKALSVIESVAASSDLALLGGLVLLKGKNLAVGIYSLVLDGLGQEAQAILRVLLETLELSAYLRTVPGTVLLAMDGKIPHAGDIARRVGSTFEDLRRYINREGAHFSLTPDSIKHLISLRDNGSRWRLLQAFVPRVARTNLTMVGLFVFFLVKEAAEILNQVSVCPEDLAQQAEQLRLSVLTWSSPRGSDEPQ